MFEKVKNSISCDSRKIDKQTDKNISVESYGLLEIANAINNFTLAFVEQKEFENKGIVDETNGGAK